MENRYMTRLACLILGLGLNVANADEFELLPTPGREELTLGAGLLYSVSSYSGADDSIIPLPIITRNLDMAFTDARVFLREGVAGIRLYRTPGIDLSLVGTIETLGYEADDSPYLRGMDQRKWSWQAGVLAALQNSHGRLFFMGLSDISGHSRGQELSVGISIPKKTQRLQIVPHLEALYLDDHWVDYYYGVKTNEATAVRPAYVGQGAMTWRVGLRLNYKLNDKWRLMGSASYTALPSAAFNSPIANKDYLFSPFIGVVYDFSFMQGQ